ncbi:MAG: ABC transporter permease [Myxococcales bacterium]|nr:ABC transporter permease [Myxococcales bacterium]
MLILDRWLEVFETLRRNKLRTTLTGLSVGWGIFMLILLLGAGQGLQNQAETNFRDDAVNSISIRPGRASLPFQGLRPGRKIRFTNADIDAVSRIPGVEHITGRFYLRGEEYTVNYGAKNASFDVRAVNPGHQFTEKTIVTSGRYLNETDIGEHRKVAVIGAPIAKFFFGKTSPIGHYLTIRGIQYKVVGTFTDEGGEGELQKIFLPITTTQRAYNAHNDVHHIIFTVGDATLERSRAIEGEVVALLARRLHFSEEDKRAVRVRNNLEKYSKIRRIFSIIRAFLWVVGIGTITASVIGVSNILLISVAERTVEIGVRKALGATPTSIVSMILKEALVVTGMAGYLGLFAGVGLLELFNHFSPNNDYITNPEVDLRVALIALGILVVSAMLAGLVPASRAARVSPIVALRNE